MSQLLQVVLSGLATGSIYALAAVGFTLVWQAARTVNFAQGEFVMLPAFFVLIAMKVFGLPLAVALVAALLASIFVLGYLFKAAVVQPLLRQSQSLNLIIATMALSLLLKESVKTFYAGEAQPYPPLFPENSANIFGAVVSVQDVCIVISALAVVYLLTMFLDKTRVGRAMQAAAQNPNVAEILGVDVQRMTLYTFLINAAMAAFASFLITPIYLAKFSSGEALGLAAFIAAIIGGFNSIRGAVAGGILLGLLDNLTATYITASYRAALPLVLLIAVILLRPEGLFGKSEGRKV
jgi:branched-chain amino acid transport system permease protein